MEKNVHPWVDRNITLYYVTEFFYALLFLIPVYIAFQNQYLTLTQMGFLAAARYIVMLLMELPTGVFADMWGRKISCAIGGAIDALGLFLIALFPTPTWIIAGTLIRALGESAISGASTALLYDTLKEAGREEEFGTITAREGMYTQVALILATLLGGFLYAFGQTVPFFLSGISVTISAVSYLFMKEPHIDSIKYSWSLYIENTKNGAKQLFKNSYVSYLSLYYIIVAGVTWSWAIYINLVYLNATGLPESAQGLVLSAVRIFNAVVLLRLTKRILSFTRAKGPWVHPALMVIGALLASVPNLTVNIFALVPFMFASNLRFNLLNKLVNDEFDSKHRATALSTLNFFMSIIFSAIVGFSGIIVELSSPSMLYILTSLIPLPFLLYLAQKIHVHYSKIYI